MKPRIRIRLKWLLIHIPTHIRIRIRLEIPSFYSYIIPWICGFKVKELLAAQGWPPAPETFRGACLGSLLIKYYLWPAAVPGILLRKHCRLLLPKALPKCCYLRIQSKNILGRSGVATGSWNFQESLGGDPCCSWCTYGRRRPPRSGRKFKAALGTLMRELSTFF